MRTAAALGVSIPILSIWALYNGAPLLYADSIDYLIHGGEAARVLFLGEPIQWVNTRSFFYALTILPLHAHGTAWPIVVAQALVAAAVLWLILRTTLVHTNARRFLAVVTLLALTTSLAWFVGYVMPDLFAALLVLGVFLLCVTGDDLHGYERVAVALLVWFASVAHASHLLLAAALVPVVALLGGLRERTLRGALRASGRLAALVLAGALGMLLLHRVLLGEASLSGRRPLFLLARTIADGPARTYLQQHCGQLDLAICAFGDRLPDNVRDVLWGENGIWAMSSEEVRERLRSEEMQVVIPAVAAEPWAQLRASAHNAWMQLTYFGMAGSYFPDPYIEARIDEALPGSGDRWFRSRQARRALHEAGFARLQLVTLGMAVVTIAAGGALLRGARRRRLWALAVLVVAALLANAAFTGALSNVEDRYQARMMWLVPLLACLVVLSLLDERRTRSASRASLTPRVPTRPPLAACP